jgi:hypothetical protein
MVDCRAQSTTQTNRQSAKQKCAPNEAIYNNSTLLFHYYTFEMISSACAAKSKERRLPVLFVPRLGRLNNERPRVSSRARKNSLSPTDALRHNWETIWMKGDITTRGQRGRLNVDLCRSITFLCLVAISRRRLPLVDCASVGALSLIGFFAARHSVSDKSPAPEESFLGLKLDWVGIEF